MTAYSKTQLQNILDKLITKIEQAGGRITIKRGVFWTICHWFVFLITLGSNREFKTRYYTTFGPVIAVPEGWESRSLVGRIATLEHELVHVEQCKSFGLGNVWLGLIPFGFLYLFFPLPVGFAYFRWRFEREAYVVGIDAELQLRAPTSVDIIALRHHLISNAVAQLTTGAYAWTFPFPTRARAYFEREVLTARELTAVSRPVGGWGE